MEHLNVVFVGHVDHGKSTLIGRLMYETGSLPEDKLREIKRISEELGHEVEFAYVMDHLSEEREQMMTIDTAQTFFHTAKRQYVIIDAPGHKELLKNMITGASQADVAVLLLDAHEGIMEQTKRHAFILGLLGVKQSVVAINKMDLVDYDEAVYARLKDELLAFLKRLQVEPVEVIPLSAKAGENIVRASETMSWYKGESLCETLDRLSPAAGTDRPLRLPVQDIYPWVESGIAAGRMESGLIAAGDKVVVEPSGAGAVVRAIRKFPASLDRAEAGECIGVLLDGGAGLSRGNVVCDPEQRPLVGSRFKAIVFWLATAPFRAGEKLTLRLATQDVACQIEKIEQRIDSSSLDIIATDADTLAETEVGRVIIRTSVPVVMESFAYLPELGRFVLERGIHMAAGGIIQGLC